jgi:hypothetical protein
MEEQLVKAKRQIYRIFLALHTAPSELSATVEEDESEISFMKGMFDCSAGSVGKAILFLSFYLPSFFFGQSTCFNLQAIQCADLSFVMVAMQAK